MPYRPTIGLEVHAELKTRTKMFCDSRNDPDETRPNINVCPICMAHPGTLPAINKEAVRHILRIGTAVGGTLANFTEFDRKSYFYPDIPKGYQISQYEYPLVKGGELCGVSITRVHLEEDTARSTHAHGKSLVDFNRAGIPLMELVTEPVIRDAETAGRFARELQLLLRTLGAGEANLEKGEMRIEANISVSDKEGIYGTKVEVKNLNSFRSVEKAIDFEIKRQSAVLEGGGKIDQETRGWDEAKQETFHQRYKEGSADYRYFPEPDLPKLYISELPEFSIETLRASLPELPWDRRARYGALSDVSADHVELFLGNTKLAELFDRTLEFVSDAPHILANYLATDVMGLVAKHGEHGLPHFTPKGLGALVRGLVSGQLSSRGAKDALAHVFTNGGDLEEVLKKYEQESNEGALTIIVDKVIQEEPKAVAEYKAGKETAIQYLVGKAMKESKGSGNPQQLRTIFLEKLA
jgi:aspartyl-tRNA(Asn)/glutamyl-tRNA(Gln) amidotransferase subunit B